MNELELVHRLKEQLANDLCACKTPLIRRNTKIRLRFQPDLDAGAVRIKQRIEFDVTNVSEQPVEFTHVLWGRLLRGPDSVAFKRLTCRDAAGKNIYDAKDEDLTKEPPFEKDAIKTIQTSQIPRHKTFRYEGVMEQTAPPYGSDAFDWAIATLGAVIEIERAPGVVVRVKFYDDRLTNLDNPLQSRFDIPGTVVLLEGQSFVYSWDWEEPMRLPVI